MNEAKRHLQGKVAVVTGASSGIGEAIAHELSAAGCSLVLTARRAERLNALRAQLPGPAVPLSAAIDEPATAQALLELAHRTYGRADILVNNAGMLVTGTLETIDLDGLMQMTRTNYDAVVRTSYVFARAFKQQGAGAIINVSSVGAYLSHSSMGVYAGLKQAVEVFSTALRVELKGSGVRVGTIAPGTRKPRSLTGCAPRASRSGRTRHRPYSRRMSRPPCVTCSSSQSTLAWRAC